MPLRIVAINHDPEFLTLLQEVLSEEGYEPHLFREGAAAYAAVRELAPAAIILDIRLEHPTAGWDLLDRLRSDAALGATPIIVCSADLPALEAQAADQGPRWHATLAKPFDIDALLDLLHHLIEEAG